MQVVKTKVKGQKCKGQDGNKQGVKVKMKRAKGSYDLTHHWPTNVFSWSGFKPTGTGAAFATTVAPPILLAHSVVTQTLQTDRQAIPILN